MTDAGAPRAGQGTAGWRRWEPAIAALAWPLALRMAAVSEVGPGQRVLDVGCGIGDPTLQVAVLVGPHGRVVGIDLDEAVLATARERAAALGIAHVEFQAGDVMTMALPASAFDVVLARWSVNYMADVVGTLARLHDALVAGGRIAVAAWAPLDVNPWIGLPLEALRAEGLPADLDASRPGLLHCSADGALARALLRAGFQAVDQERVRLSYVAETPDELWGMLTDAAGGPLAPLLAGLDAPRTRAVAARVAVALEAYRTGDLLRVPAQAQLAWGRA
jgi:SAM-dependent methyltransferase